MVDRLAELGALQYAAANTATASVNPSRIAASGYIHAMYAEYVTWSLANPGVNPSRLSAKGRIFGYFYDNATFSPLSLFAASEVGAWYDPSDLTTMFQDSAGTTPVTADGQPVGLILDKSGRGNHATQATAASRPLYKTDGTYHWLQFDGVDDSLSTETIDFTSTDKMSVFAGLYKQSDAATAILVELTPALLNGGFYITAPENAAPNFGFGLNITGAVGVVASPFAATAKFVVCSAFDGSFVNSSNSMRARINSALVSTTGGGNSGIGSFANANLFIGRRAESYLPFNGKIYSLIIRGALSTPQEITDTETWVNSKTGAY